MFCRDLEDDGDQRPGGRSAARERGLKGELGGTASKERGNGDSRWEANSGPGSVDSK